MSKNLNIDLKNIDLKKLAGALKNINLGSLKKYSSLLPSTCLLGASVIILAAAFMVGKTVSKKMDESAAVASQLLSIASTVPSERQAKVEEDYLQKYVQDVNAVEQMAINTSRRELICYSPVIFPEPTDTSGQVYNVFGKKYRSAIESLLGKINAKDAPSEAEIRSATGVGSASAGAGGMGGMPGIPGFGGMGMSPAAGSQNAMVDAVCLRRSEEIPVYANPGIFNWYNFWENFTYKSKDESLRNCWSSQVAFWIYEDIIATAETLNTGSAKVATSPVKRLLGVSFDGPVVVEVSEGTMAGMSRAGQEAIIDTPIYVKNLDSTAGGSSAVSGTSVIAGPSPFVTDSLTGRTSDDQIDVIHFAVSAIVDAASVSQFMKELCSVKTHTFQDEGKTVNAVHNQISILNFATEPVSLEDVIHANYRYGKAAVVQVNLVCEYIFNRKGYDVLKPKVIKKDLGEQVDDQQAGGTGMGFPGSM